MSKAEFTPAMGDYIKGIPMSYALVIDKNKRPCNPCHPALARILLNQGKAAVFRRFPFVIILKDERTFLDTQLLRVKIDPGSKTTGLALVDDSTGKIYFALELIHMGQYIHEQLLARKAIRRGRRYRNTRYRKPRFDNRVRPEGWLAPSIKSRVGTTITWVTKLLRYCPINAISLELAKFDTQLMQNAEIEGVQYQQGELAGYELREYLLEKFNRRCVYCKVNNVPLEIEHIVPLSRGGSHRISNLTLACRPCNQKKGNKTAKEYGHPHVQQQAQASLKDAAALNSTRWQLYQQLLSFGLPVEVGTGGRTKYNRIQRNLPKNHWIDAACVGESTPDHLTIKHVSPLFVKAIGHGSRQMCRVDSYGFPRTSAKGAGYQTGDIVRAVVPKGKKKGTYTGKVAIRSSGYFNIVTSSTTIQGVSFRYCKLIHGCDGYSYHYIKSASSAP
jgi:5-methylcytosine-specific restriction endonuclease McrA